MNNDDIVVEVYEPDAIVLEIYDGLQGPPGIGNYISPVTLTIPGVSSFTTSHPFPYKPNVIILDAGGNAVDTEVSYPTLTTVHLSFAAPFTGTLILS